MSWMLMVVGALVWPVVAIVVDRRVRRHAGRSTPGSVATPGARPAGATGWTTVGEPMSVADEAQAWLRATDGSER